MRTFTGIGFAAIMSGAVIALFAQPRPVFEAADVHRSARAMNPYTFISGGVLRGARYDLRKATMLDLIRIAYKVEPEMILGGPNWLEFDRFDIAAEAPPSSSPETIRLMLQSLLADRFKLLLHKDTRPMPAYALTAGKGSLAAGDGNPECQYQPQPGGSPFGTVYSCRNMTMAAFAERLHGIAGDYLIDPVVDSTGIEGAWDFDLKWNYRSQVLQAGAERTTIFSAVEKQLGLSLTLQKAPAPVLVIDRVNEKPTDNAPGVAPDIAQKLPPRELEFEVADLKPSKPGEPGGGMRVTPGGGLEARAMDMRVLLAAAWDIDWDHLERFAGLPKWVESAKFDIHAKAYTSTNGPPFMGSGYIDDDVRLMLRALLIDRFKMKVHYEDRLVDAYALVAAKPGVKMKRADPANRAGCRDARTVANDPRDINPRLSQLIACRNTTMVQFASQLQALSPDYFAYPVEDATGLTGGWDFSLSFSPAWMLSAASPERAGATSGASEPIGALSLADAISRQLGLKLEMRKRMLPVVVIDHI
jgi:uncharacterized protein (TIGR03435 family)